MGKNIAVVFLLMSMMSTFNSWPTGAPDEACQTLTPQHGANRPMSASQSPFTVTQSQTNFQPGDRIKVVVQAPPGVSFKGLIVQGVDVSTNQPIGLFEPGRGLKVIDSCSAVTHSDRRGKRAATLVWDAPQDRQGRVTFRATVVQRFSEFFGGLQSQVNPNV